MTEPEKPPRCMNPRCPDRDAPTYKHAPTGLTLCAACLKRMHVPVPPPGK